MAKPSSPSTAIATSWLLRCRRRVSMSRFISLSSTSNILAIGTPRPRSTKPVWRKVLAFGAERNYLVTGIVTNRFVTYHGRGPRKRRMVDAPRSPNQTSDGCRVEQGTVRKDWSPPRDPGIPAESNGLPGAAVTAWRYFYHCHCGFGPKRDGRMVPGTKRSCFAAAQRDQPVWRGISLQPQWTPILGMRRSDRIRPAGSSGRVPGGVPSTGVPFWQSSMGGHSRIEDQRRIGVVCLFPMQTSATHEYRSR